MFHVFSHNMNHKHRANAMLGKQFAYLLTRIFLLIQHLPLILIRNLVCATILVEQDKKGLWLLHFPHSHQHGLNNGASRRKSAPISLQRSQ